VRAPRLAVPGSNVFQTQPDGLWLTFGSGRSDVQSRATHVDCFVVESCGTAQNLNDKRARYAARTSSLMVEMHQPWLDCDVSLQAGAQRKRREVLQGSLESEGIVLLPVRHLRLLYALSDEGKNSLYHSARASMVFEAHEFVCPQRLLSQWNTQKMQEFLKRIAPRRQYF
jgi:hypothetical protein